MPVVAPPFFRHRYRRNHRSHPKRNRMGPARAAAIIGTARDQMIVTIGLSRWHCNTRSSSSSAVTSRGIVKSVPDSFQLGPIDRHADIAVRANRHLRDHRRHIVPLQDPSRQGEPCPTMRRSRRPASAWTQVSTCRLDPVMLHGRTIRRAVGHLSLSGILWNTGAT